MYEGNMKKKKKKSSRSLSFFYDILCRIEGCGLFYCTLIDLEHLYVPLFITYDIVNFNNNTCKKENTCLKQCICLNKKMHKQLNIVF